MSVVWLHEAYQFLIGLRNYREHTPKCVATHTLKAMLVRTHTHTCKGAFSRTLKSKLDQLNLLEGSVIPTGLTDSCILNLYVCFINKMNYITLWHISPEMVLFLLPPSSGVMTSSISKRSKRWGQRLVEVVGLIAYLAAPLLTSTANRMLCSTADSQKHADPTNLQLSDLFFFFFFGIGVLPHISKAWTRRIVYQALLSLSICLPPSQLPPHIHASMDSHCSGCAGAGGLIRSIGAPWFTEVRSRWASSALSPTLAFPAAGGSAEEGRRNSAYQAGDWGPGAGRATGTWTRSLQTSISPNVVW